MVAVVSGSGGTSSRLCKAPNFSTSENLSHGIFVVVCFCFQFQCFIIFFCIVFCLSERQTSPLQKTWAITQSSLFGLQHTWPLWFQGCQPPPQGVASRRAQSQSLSDRQALNSECSANLTAFFTFLQIIMRFCHNFYLIKGNYDSHFALWDNKATSIWSERIVERDVHHGIAV